MVGSFSKHPEEWLVTREYTEIHTGAAVYLGGEYDVRKLFRRRLFQEFCDVTTPPPGGQIAFT